MSKTIKNKLSETNGFTLIELLLVIGMIAILATIVFVALNPVARFQEARNARRWSDVESILSAINLNHTDKKKFIDSMSPMTPGQFYQIGTAGPDPNCALSCGVVTLEAECIDLSELVDTGYLPAIPYDPSGSGAAPTFTHYYISESTTGATTVGSCDAENGLSGTPPQISITK